MNLKVMYHVDAVRVPTCSSRVKQHRVILIKVEPGSTSAAIQCDIIQQGFALANHICTVSVTAAPLQVVV